MNLGNCWPINLSLELVKMPDCVYIRAVSRLLKIWCIDVLKKIPTCTLFRNKVS